MRVLSSGVDTLDLTVRGVVRPEVWDLVDEARMRAEQAGEPQPLELAGQAFGVQGHGWRNYSLWLRSHNYELMLGRNEHFPAARVEVSSACLHSLGPRLASELVESTLRCAVLSGEVEPVVSRIDLYADAQGWPLQVEDIRRFVTRARSRRGHVEDEQALPDRIYTSATAVTGLDFGRRGGGVYVRIYDKTTEIRQRGLAWLPDLWGPERAEGPVWRVEAELRRPLLAEHGLRSADEVLAGIQDLWRYVTTRWLSLRVPTSDGRRRRWPVDPAWQVVRSVELAPTQLGVVRRRIAEATEYQLLQGAIGYLTGLAAMHPEWNGLNDCMEGMRVTFRRYLDETGRTWPAEVRKKRAKYLQMSSWGRITKD